MCGIFGYSSKSENVIDKLPELRNALNTLYHRGPDSSGEYYNQNIFLGHRRLSIIDLSSSADQPFKSATENAYIIFNGEIYNYKELKNKLGPLKTNSDTEVLLEGYLKFGPDFFKDIRGIYAFAIYDFRSEPKIILYRDLAGVKPLYYFKNDSTLIFASEIKAIRTIAKNELTIDESILKSYLSLGYCIEPSTIYNEIKAVEPGECIEIKTETGKTISRILFRYTLDDVNTFSFEENVIKARELLLQAAQRNLVADVDVSIALSGGIDSSLIYAFANTDRSYKGISVKFNDKDYDETAMAKVYAQTLNAPLDIIETSTEGNLELLNKLLLHFDQPYSDTSAIPFYFLSKRAVENSKVLIGGDGGDEIQNGYPSFCWLPYIHKVSNNAWLQKTFLLGGNMLKRMLNPDNARRMLRLNELVKLNNEEEMICEWQSWLSVSNTLNHKSPFLYDTRIVKDVYKNSFNSILTSDFSQSMVKNYFYKRMLGDYLRKADMMSMMNGLEYRVPMLDEDLVSFSFSIPYNQKSNSKVGKLIFRNIHQQIFPKETSNAPKTGFGIPLDKWLTKSDYSYMENYVLDPKGIVTNYIEKSYVHFLFESLGNRKNADAISRVSVYQRIIMLYSLQLWYFNN
jgi:asparagine synthase (glutamine-hydrolysing)